MAGLRPNKRKPSDANAGPGPVRDEPTTPAPPPVPAVARFGNVLNQHIDERIKATEQAKPRKFTALLDGPTDTRYGRLLDELRQSVGPIATRSDGNGRTRAGYDLSRADLLRALLEVADDDPSVMTDAAAKVRHHYGATS